MSSGWSWFVIIVTFANIAGAWWLLHSNSKVPKEELEAGDTTGHTWDDDLAEYNNPLPRWWMILFYLTMVFAVVYLILYPGLGNNAGALGWSQVGQHAEEAAAADAQFDAAYARFDNIELGDLSSNDDATAMGRNLFLTTCATCHGSDARGMPGFPDLGDEAWLYGGEPEMVLTSILNGRAGMMPALGPALGTDGITEVVAHVTIISGGQADAELAAAGAARFAMLCAACHGPTGGGNQMLGAPDLTDGNWLYGGDPETLATSIESGRNGQMPAHRPILGEDRARLIAAYVLSLSNDVD